MSAEFEKTVMQKLDLVVGKLDNVENRLDNLEEKFDNLEERFDNFEERFDNLENKVEKGFKSLEKQIDIMKNVNLATILNTQIKNNNEQNKNYKEIIKKMEKYEKNNELEHSRLNYEICKLKANA